MKSINKEPGDNQVNQNNKSTSAAAKRGSGANEINSGEIGAEGSIYNGASELRQLRKKHNK
jgi:hypothetical protein